jgi:hypothetical protein
MKGTLFSADFIKDADANLRLLELNTDTGFIANTLSSRFDFTSFISILNSNSITELVLVYKSMQRGFVALLKDTIATDATFITTVTEQVEDNTTIYPSVVTDSSEKFILRLAYDENALLDSTYCKDRVNLQKLFYDNSATGSIPEFYCSGSEYEVNTLRSNINDHATLPDFVSKPKSETHSALVFYNIGCSESSSAERTTRLVSHSDIDYGVNTIEKFHYNLDELANNNKMSGYRVVGIVYGTDIDYVNIGEWKVESFFEIPTISEINYITNNDDVPSIIEDFEITLDDANIFGDGTTASQSSITGKKCMKVVTTTDGDKWQSGQIYLQHGDLDLTTSNKLVQVEVYSDVATWILMKVIQPRNGTGEESATHASHGGTGWETIDFNFSEPQDNTPIANDLYGRIAFFPLWNGEAFDDSEVTTTYYKTISALRYTVETADNFINFYEDKHYYQLTSNWIRTTAGDGLFTDTGILNLDNTSGKVQTYEVDDVVKSIFINGLPDTDTEAIYSTWSSAGNELPSGSYVTSSIIESVTELTGKTEYGIVGEIKLSEDEVIYTTVAKNFLVYDTGSDAMSFEQQFNINPNEHFLVNASGSLIPIISNNIVVFDNEDGGLLYQLDVETTDAYFVSSSVSPLIVHNCFIAGTMIKLNDGTDVAIEDIAIGDEILTYNETKEENQCGIVGDLKEHKVDSTICITLGEPNTRISDCNVITTTSEHPFFVKDKGWVIASELEAGNFCFSKSHEWVEILDISISGENTVYNLLNVEPTHTFYVNGILVHNKVLTPLCCFVAGTEIELSNGDSKNIEDIIVGDEVIGWKDGERINGVVSELKPTYLGNRSLYNINDLKITFTDEHPFLTKDGWKSIAPDEGTEYGLLVVGDEINHEGEWITINEFKEIEGEDYNQPVYNFTVEDIHSYIADGVIVHNK